VIATLRYGIQQAAQTALGEAGPNTTVAQAIEELLRSSKDPWVADQVRSALGDPLSIIELRSGKQVQTVNPEVPLRELVSPESGQLEITINQPHAGG
jgi:hypothetical protein